MELLNLEKTQKNFGNAECHITLMTCVQCLLVINDTILLNSGI